MCKRIVRKKQMQMNMYLKCAKMKTLQTKLQKKEEKKKKKKNSTLIAILFFFLSLSFFLLLK
jgi:hypothetical protein